MPTFDSCSLEVPALANLSLCTVMYYNTLLYGVMYCTSNVSLSTVLYGVL